MTLQKDQIIDDVARDKIGSVAGEQSDNQTTLLNDKLDFPLDITLSGDVITIEAGTKQKLESDGSNGTQNAHKLRLPLISNNDVSPALSTIDLTDGSTTADFKNDPPTCPTLTASYYIQMGIELRSDGKHYVVFGPEKVTSDTLPPTFSAGSLQLLIVKLQDSGGGGTWNFSTPSKSDLEKIPLGGGASSGSSSGGGQDVFQTFDAENDSVGDWTKGNNATWDNGGSLIGAFAVSETDPINGTKSYTLTQGATSINDWLASKEFDIPLRSRGKTCSVRLPYLYDGADNDFKVVVKDISNGDILTSALNFVKSETGTPATLVATFLVPDNCLKMKFGFHCLVTNNTKILKFDDVVLSDDPFVYKNLTVTQDYELKQAQSAMTNLTAELEWNLGTATISDEGDSLVSAEDDSGNTRTKFVANKKCVVGVSTNGLSSSANNQVTLIHYDSGGTEIKRVTGQQQATATRIVGFSASIELETGEFFTISMGTVLSGGGDICRLQFVAQAQSEHVVTPSTAPKSYDRSGVGEITGTNFTTDFAELMPYLTGDGKIKLKFNINGTFSDNIQNRRITIADIDISENQAISFDNLSALVWAKNNYTDNNGGLLITDTNVNATGRCYWSGDIFLSEWPTWADPVTSQYLAYAPVISNWQTKILSADVTSDGEMTDLTCTLVIGKRYRVCGQMAFKVNNAGVDIIEVIVDDGSQEVTHPSASTQNSGRITDGLNAIFTATSTSLTFTASSASAVTSRVEGNGERSRTFIQLEELPNHIEI